MEPVAAAGTTDSHISAPADLPRKTTGFKWILLVIAVLSAIFLFALDNTIVADVQPRIVDSLGEIEKLPWISVAFALGAVSVNLLWYVDGDQTLATKSRLVVLMSMLHRMQGQDLLAVRIKDLLFGFCASFRGWLCGVRFGANHERAYCWANSVRYWRLRHLHRRN